MSGVKIFTDGACSGNPGPGGYAAILIYNDKEKIISGFESNTTNNRMELLAAIKGLEALKKSCTVDLTTDSQYLKRGMTEWLVNWKKTGKLGNPNSKLKNQDLWQELDKLAQIHKINWHWVYGHSGHPENERADEAARAEIYRNVKK